MKLFLTGATGFIGGRLLRQLVESGHEVTCLVREPARAQGLSGPRVTIAAGDITDAGSVRRGMAGAEGVFHLAAWYKVGARDRSMAERINVDGTRNVLEAMRDLGVRKGVYTSTLAVFSDTRGRVVDETYRHRGGWLSEYERTKAAAHYEVALPMIERGLPLVIAQPGVNYGPGDTSAVREVLVQYLTRRLPMVPRGTAYCWAHVDDTAAGHALCMERGEPGGTYILGGPVHTLIEALETAERITGIPAPRLRPSGGVVRGLAAVMSVVEKVVPLPETMTGEGLLSIAGVTYTASNAKARRALGYDPRPLEVGLRETLEHEMRLLGIAPRR